MRFGAGWGTSDGAFILLFRETTVPGRGGGALPSCHGIKKPGHTQSCLSSGLSWAWLGSGRLHAALAALRNPHSLARSLSPIC